MNTHQSTPTCTASVGGSCTQTIDADFLSSDLIDNCIFVLKVFERKMYIYLHKDIDERNFETTSIIRMYEKSESVQKLKT